MVFELGADHGAWTEEFVAFQREDFGVTFLKQPEDARFTVEIAEFGLDAESEPET